MTGTLAVGHIAALVLAHQFGWDEILMFVAPVVLALLGLRWFEKRSQKTEAGGRDENDKD